VFGVGIELIEKDATKEPSLCIQGSGGECEGEESKNKPSREKLRGEERAEG